MDDPPVIAILKTEDMRATLEWYAKAGFRLLGMFPEDENECTWAELTRDGVTLQFLSGETPWPGAPSFTGTIYFHPESVDAVHEEIRDAIEPAWGPEVREWGTKELGLQDPNGYFLTFTQPADD